MTDIMNVYQLYEAQGCKLPMSVLRITSPNTYWMVESIGGQTEGQLPGRPPYYGNPHVIASRYQRTAYSNGPPVGAVVEEHVLLPCPGSYQWLPFEPKDS